MSSSRVFKVLHGYPVSSRSTTGHTQRQHVIQTQSSFRSQMYRLAIIAREEGFAALYKGFLPKVLRLAPGGGVLLLVVEFTLDVFRKGTLGAFISSRLLLTTSSALGPPYL